MSPRIRHQPLRITFVWNWYPMVVGRTPIESHAGFGSGNTMGHLYPSRNGTGGYAAMHTGSASWQPRAAQNWVWNQNRQPGSASSRYHTSASTVPNTLSIHSSPPFNHLSLVSSPDVAQVNAGNSAPQVTRLSPSSVRLLVVSSQMLIEPSTSEMTTLNPRCRPPKSPSNSCRNCRPS